MGDGRGRIAVVRCTLRGEERNLLRDYVYRRALYALSVFVSSELDIADYGNLVALFGVAGNSFAQAAPSRYVVEIGLALTVGRTAAAVYGYAETAYRYAGLRFRKFRVAR